MRLVYPEDLPAAYPLQKGTTGLELRILEFGVTKTRIVHLKANIYNSRNIPGPGWIYRNHCMCEYISSSVALHHKPVDASAQTCQATDSNGRSAADD